MWLFSKHLRASTFVFISFLLILIGSFMVSLSSPYVLISDRTQPDERLRNLKEGANATIEANNCSQTTDILPNFIKCKRGTLLYSAWFDDRYDEKLYPGFVLTRRRKQPPPLSCRFQNTEVNFYYGSTSSIMKSTNDTATNLTNVMVSSWCPAFFRKI